MMLAYLRRRRILSSPTSKKKCEPPYHITREPHPGHAKSTRILLVLSRLPSWLPSVSRSLPGMYRSQPAGSRRGVRIFPWACEAIVETFVWNKA